MTAREDEERAIRLLRHLILGEEGDKFDRLEEEIAFLRNRIVDKESLITSLDPVIADLLERKIMNSRDDMADALAPVMSEAIKKQVYETREDVVDALYPVIGQTIKRSMSEAMQDLVSGVNHRIEKALIRNLLPRKLQAKLMGLSEAELMVKESLPFEIEQIFLIHLKTGLLVSHVASSDGDKVDQELISGMLTAIRDFVSEAFREDPNRELSEIQYGDAKIILELGRYSYLAVVVSGVEPQDFRDRLHKLSERLHNLYFKELRQFDGELTELEGCERELARFLAIQKVQEQTQSKTKTRPYFKYLILFTLVLFMIVTGAFFVPQWIENGKHEKQLFSTLEAQPGINVDQLEIDVNDGDITLAGVMNSFWARNQADSIATAMPFTKSVDNHITVMVDAVDQEKLDQQIEEKVTQYQAEPYFSPKFIITQDRLTIEGFVSNSQTRRDLGHLLSEIPGVKVVHNNLRLVNETELAEAKQLFNENTLFFEKDSISVEPFQKQKIDRVSDYFATISDKFHLVVRGFSNDHKDFYDNLRTAKQRAENVAEHLVNSGIHQNRLVVLYYGQKYPILEQESLNSPLKNSRVEFDIIFGESYFAQASNRQ